MNFSKFLNIIFLLGLLTFSTKNFAAVTAGNKSYINPTPSSSTYTYSSHNQNTGSDGYLVVCVVSTSTFGVTISGATWNGVAMTQLQQATISGESCRMALFELEDPATGTNDLVITWSTTQSYSVSVSIFSFTGAQSGGNSEINQSDATPTEPGFTISDQSMVLGIGASTYETTSIELPQGTSRTLLFSHNAYGKTVKGALSPALSSGTSTYEANTTTGNASLALVEIQEAAAAPASRRVIIIN